MKDEHSPESATENLQNASVSRTALWTGRIIGAIAILYLLLDSVSHILQLPAVEEWRVNILGFPAHTTLSNGLILLVCIIVYLIPRTSVLGAILLTGYLGGAVAINVRINSPFFSHILLPVYVGIMIWGRLYLKEVPLRNLIPFKKN